MLKRKILVTGGSGFLGRGLLRRIRREDWAAEVTVYSRDGKKQAELRRLYPEAHCVLGDVRDLNRLTAVAAGHDLVIHAAALKHIPEAEHNVDECFAVNIDGSRNVALAAVQAGVPQVIGLSTDKACAPMNTYGLSKAAMERIFAEANRWGETQFATVRYGNVVGSTGSVIPLFYQQLEDFGEVRVTDKNMTRFWISVDEAIDLISYAVEKRVGTIVYRCGAMKIADLAELIAAGKPVRITGIRPGERLDERLVDYSESQHCEQDGDYYLLYPPTAKRNGDHEPWTYVSSNPAHWIEKQEMAAMIEDAKGV